MFWEVAAEEPPVLLRTTSWGWVSDRFLVIASDVGDGTASLVCRRGGGGGRGEVARDGEAGGVWVWVFERGRVVGVARGSSEAEPLRCRLLRKLKPRRPEGRDASEGEPGEGAAGAAAVYMNDESMGVDGDPVKHQNVTRRVNYSSEGV